MVLRFSLFALALLFISCTDFVRDNPHDPEGVNYLPSSSSQDVGSSSSFDPFMRDCGFYCLWDNTGCNKATTDPGGLYGDPIYDCESQLSNCKKNSLAHEIFSDANCKTVQ